MHKCMQLCLIPGAALSSIREEESAMTTKVAERAGARATRKPTRPRPVPTRNAEGLVARVRRELALSRREYSRLTGYSERAIVNWENGRTPDEPALRRIREIDRLRTRLSRVVKPAFI